MAVASPALGAGRPLSVLRPIAALGALALAIAIVTVWSAGYRAMEASAAATVVRIWTPSVAVGPAFCVSHGSDPLATDNGAWFVVSAECTTGLLMIPLLMFAAFCIVQQRLRPTMVLAGLSAGAVLLMILGTVRLSTIGLAYHQWGKGSLWATHTLVGTLISLASTLAGLGTQAVVSGWRTPQRVREFSP